MTSYPIIQRVTLSLSNISNEIYPIINCIRPDWNPSNTFLKKFTEGITNTILGLFHNRTNDDDGLIIKLFGAKSDLFIDRQSEVDAMLLLSKQGVLSQRILIQLNNGIIYEYAPAETCSREDVRKEKISKLIAIKLAQFHSVPVQTNEKPYLFTLMRKFLALLNLYEEEKKSLCGRKKIVSD